MWQAKATPLHNSRGYHSPWALSWKLHDSSLREPLFFIPILKMRKSGLKKVWQPDSQTQSLKPCLRMDETQRCCRVQGIKLFQGQGRGQDHSCHLPPDTPTFHASKLPHRKKRREILEPCFTWASGGRRKIVRPGIFPVMLNYILNQIPAVKSHKLHEVKMKVSFHLIG